MKAAFKGLSCKCSVLSGTREAVCSDAKFGDLSTTRLRRSGRDDMWEGESQLSALVEITSGKGRLKPPRGKKAHSSAARKRLAEIGEGEGVVCL